MTPFKTLCPECSREQVQVSSTGRIAKHVREGSHPDEDDPYCGASGQTIVWAMEADVERARAALAEQIHPVQIKICQTILDAGEKNLAKYRLLINE